VNEKPNPKQMLLELARNEGPDVLHLPYSREFETLCRQINPTATTQDKHQIWEELLKLQSAEILPATPLAKPVATPILATPIAPQPPPPLARQPDESGFLFQTEPPNPELQPWALPPEPSLAPEIVEQRIRLLADIADSRLATHEQRVARILERYPETRDSDIALCLRYWRIFQADVIEEWQPLELEILFKLDRMDTLSRERRFVQNDLRLFRGKEATHKTRDAMQREFHEYIAAHQGLPEVHFYLDETGNEGDKTYTGVAGVCIFNWKQYEKHHAALAQWRNTQGWAETVHFADTGADKVDRAVSLLQQLSQRRSGVLFLGYSIASRGRTQEAMYSLFIQLVLDSLRHLQMSGSLTGNRSIRVIKEADPGFDGIYLAGMTKQLADMVALEFPGHLAVLPVEAVTKGRNVLLECADLIAGGMQRRALGKGRNPKDRLAEAVINVTGFEDSCDTGALFKYFPFSPGLP
jgi:hypothetical protein